MEKRTPEIAKIEQLAERMRNEAAGEEFFLYRAGAGDLEKYVTLLGTLERMNLRFSSISLTLETPDSASKTIAFHGAEYRKVIRHPRSRKHPVAFCLDNSIHTGKTMLGIVVHVMETAEDYGTKRIYTAAFEDKKLNIVHMAIERTKRVPYRPMVPDFMREKAPETYRRFLGEAKKAEELGDQPYGVKVPLLGTFSFLSGRRPRDRFKLYSDYVPPETKVHPWAIAARKLINRGPYDR